MSEEQLNAFFFKMKKEMHEGNFDFREKIENAGSLDEALAIAREAGFDVTRSDWLRCISEGRPGYGVLQNLENAGGWSSSNQA
jgi:predicted ribosomally synthesized peptide with nif11-like leader